MTLDTKKRPVGVPRADLDWLRGCALTDIDLMIVSLRQLLQLGCTRAKRLESFGG